MKNFEQTINNKESDIKIMAKEAIKSFNDFFHSKSGEDFGHKLEEMKKNLNSDIWSQMMSDENKDFKELWNNIKIFSKKAEDIDYREEMEKLEKYFENKNPKHEEKEMGVLEKSAA